MSSVSSSSNLAQRYWLLLTHSQYKGQDYQHHGNLQVQLLRCESICHVAAAVLNVQQQTTLCILHMKPVSKCWQGKEVSLCQSPIKQHYTKRRTCRRGHCVSVTHVFSYMQSMYRKLTLTSVLEGSCRQAPRSPRTFCRKPDPHSE